MENQITFVTKKPKQCPFCGKQKIAEILYGEPIFSEQLQNELDQGKTVLGGCCITSDSPQYQCIKCKAEFTVNKEAAASIFTDAESNYAMLVYGSKNYMHFCYQGYPEIQIYKDNDDIYTAKLYQVSNLNGSVKTLKSAKNLTAEFVEGLISQLRSIKINLFAPKIQVLDGGLSYLRLANWDVTLFITWNALPEDWHEVENAVELLTGIFPEFEAMSCFNN